MTSRLAAFLALAACAPDEPTPEPGGACEGQSRAALTAADRKIVGDAGLYPADHTLRARDDELRTSKRARREVAWQTARRVLEPVPLSEPLPAYPRAPAAVPLWQTWYDFDDVRRVFHHLYAELSTDEKKARARFSAADLDAAFLWNTTSVEELPSWPVERWLAYLDAIDTSAEVAGVGGISRVAYSPGAVRHLLRSYPDVLGCRSAGPPPPHEVGPLEAVEIARAPIESAACQSSSAGSFAILADESLRVVLEGGDDATLVVQTDDETCTAAPDIPCVVAGPATVEVRVDAGAGPVSSVVSVTRESTHPAWAACLDGPFPTGAVIVKADYRRSDFEMTMPVYDTSGPALAGRLSGDASWETADGEADPGPDDIYSLTLPSGASYRLAALHVMTKELDHWLWVTLWWSPSPDGDFGADRPGAIDALGGAWSSYKMCVVTAFDEGDAAPGGGFEADHPSLAEALAAVHGGVGAPTWCSNPYLEEGHGNAATNCIGCHQHGGATSTSEEILLFPGHGTSLARNNFPTDYAWAVTDGDRIGDLFAEEELYYLGPP